MRHGSSATLAPLDAAGSPVSRTGGPAASRPAKLSGFGIGLRQELMAELLVTERRIDWLEIIAENWIDLGGERFAELERCAERWPLVPHGVTMSIGGVAPLDPALFASVSALCRRLDAPFWSDHVACATIDGTHFNDLLPVPFTEAAVEHVLSRIAQARTMTDVPLAFENPTYYARMPGATMPEATFLREVIRGSGSGLLLDVNNVYVNGANHGFDPYRFIDALPMDAVWQIHLAGHSHDESVIIDTHVGPIPEPVWDLYRHALRRAGHVVPTLIEWDAEIPALDVVLDELDRARSEAAAALAEVAA